jgi:hypothetical protein
VILQPTNAPYRLSRHCCSTVQWGLNIECISSTTSAWVID